jgi:glycosyltransferase involved in cell wall biosynthesis
MQIGVDATCWQNQRGYGRHARALLSALVRADRANRYTFVLDSKENVEALPREAEAHWVRTSTPTVRAASANGHRSVRDLWRVSRALSSADFDLVLFPTIYSYVPVFSRAKKVVAIHDVIPEKYPHLTQPQRAARWFWQTKAALGRWQADAIVTVSDYSRRQLLEQFHLKPERVFVVGEAADPKFRCVENPPLTQRLTALCIKPSSRTLIYVGGFSPHKNLEALIQVLASVAAQERFSDVRLVMVGEYDKEVFHSYFGTIKQRARELGVAERVIFAGFLPDDELVTLLNLGTALVLPSLMEGFGLPAIEAASCGCPVIATKASPLPQILGEGGIYIDPTQAGDLETALTSVLESGELRQRMSQAGLAAMRRLSWDTAARQMLELIRIIGAT